MAENGEIARLHALLARAEADLQHANAQIASLEASERCYQSMFDGIDEGLCVIEMIEDEAGRPIDYRFLHANTAFGRQTGLEYAIGRTVRDMVPGQEQYWFDIYGRIARTGIAERFEDRAEALERWYDVYAMPFGEPGDLRVAVLFRDVSERKRTETRLLESENRLAAIFESAPVGIALADRNGNMVLANAEAQRLFPSRKIPSHDSELGPRWRAVSDDGEAVALSDYPAIKALNGISTVPGMEFTRTDEDGAVHWATVSSVPLRDDGGTVSGSVIVIHDVDELKRSQEALRESERRLQMLLAELQHRVRNILTVIRSVFSRTVETGGDIQSIANHFTGRLDNLARTQMVATQNAHGYADLENLIRDELLSVGVSDGQNVTIGGPGIELTTQLTESLGLAVHELTTNALKYGALRFPEARLEIHWEVNLDDKGICSLDLTWSEQGVPVIISQPTRRGFGCELIEDALPYRSGVTTSLEFRGGGVFCLLSAPQSEGGAGAAWKEL